jgi:hypothetical protein
LDIRERSNLIALTSYLPLAAPTAEGPFQKISCAIEQGILPKMAGRPLSHFVSKMSSRVVFVHRIVRYFAKALSFVPVFVDGHGARGKSEDYKEFAFEVGELEQITAMLNSTLFYCFGGHTVTDSIVVQRCIFDALCAYNGWQ